MQFFVFPFDIPSPIGSIV